MTLRQGRIWAHIEFTHLKGEQDIHTLDLTFFLTEVFKKRVI